MKWKVWSKSGRTDRGYDSWQDQNEGAVEGCKIELRVDFRAGGSN